MPLAAIRSVGSAGGSVTGSWTKVAVTTAGAFIVMFWGLAAPTRAPVQTSKIIDAVSQYAKDTGNTAHQLIVLCSPQIRAQVRRLIESALPNVPVLAYNEVVKGIQVQSVGLVSAELT